MDSPSEVGDLTIIIGCMFSGKTTDLINRLTTEADIMWQMENKTRALLVNHSDDAREDVLKSSDGITTHNSGFRGISSRVDVIKCSELSQVPVSKYNVIGIDEGQFFGDLEKSVRRWVLELGKSVIVASLDSDFRLDRFGQVLDLIPLCGGDLVKRHAICQPHLSMGKKVKAYYTAKVSGDGNQKQPGGSDMYKPVCLGCHKSISKK